MQRVPLFATIHIRTLVLLFAVPFLAAAWWWAAPQLLAPVLSPTEAVSGKLIVIDPGHGGPDPGAVGRSGLLEKDVVLAVAHDLQPLLGRSAVYTLMLREDDHDLATGEGTGTRKREDLQRRVDLANEAEADLYVSLHANAFPSSQWSGAQTFYYPGKEDGKRLAEAIQARLREHFPENTRLARPGEYFVLRKTNMPAVVVEVGFLSNPTEEELLGIPGHRQEIAHAVFLGIVDYLTLVAEEVDHEGPELSSRVVDPAAVFVNATPGVSNLSLVTRDEGEFLLFFDASARPNDGLTAIVETFPDEIKDAGQDVQIEYALRRLIAGPSATSALFRTLPRETKVLDVEVIDGRAYVDLSREVRTRFWGGGQSEALLVESLVRTVGQFDGVEEVSLSVEGEVGGTIAGHVDLGTHFLVPPPASRP